MNITLITTALTALLLSACAASSGPPATGKTATAAKSAAPVECVEESATGSNIKRRRCYANDPESQRQRQAQIDAMQRPNRPNSGATAQQ